MPYRFNFTPPIALPGPGNYHFAIQTHPGSGIFFFPLSKDDAYQQGDTWWYAPTGGGSYLRSNPVDNGPVDVAFEVEFCGTVTPARMQTWGEVKAAYR